MGIYYRELARLSWFERAFANTFFGKVPDGSFEDSIEMFNKALMINNNMIVATYQLSKTYRALGSEKKEVELLKKVIKLPERNFRDKFAKRKAERRLGKLI
jgi:tetratricopeptide (TPR) repeat protein